jgi:hypothetical protein
LLVSGLPEVICSQNKVYSFLVALQREIGDQLAVIGLEGISEWNGTKALAEENVSAADLVGRLEFLTRSVEHLNDLLAEDSKVGKNHKPAKAPRPEVLLLQRADWYARAKASPHAVPEEFRQACAMLEKKCREMAGCLVEDKTPDKYVAALIDLMRLLDARLRFRDQLSARCVGSERPSLNEADHVSAGVVGGGALSTAIVFSAREQEAVRKVDRALPPVTSTRPRVVVLLYGASHDFGPSIHGVNTRSGDAGGRYALSDVWATTEGASRHLWYKAMLDAKR